jgi:hypothetical protein
MLAGGQARGTEQVLNVPNRAEGVSDEGSGPQRRS